MFSFRILKKSSRSQARIGVISTPHGEIETPAFIPVATRGAVRMLDMNEVGALGSQMLICNTYHLHLSPGEDIVAQNSSLHVYCNWNKPLMTDSGGFQVFSLGFGSDHGVGKILNAESAEKIEKGDEPKSVKITEDGVLFRSPIDGKEIYLDPKISIGIQQKLGADIMFAFDECPSPLADIDYLRHSMNKTHRWAQESLNARTSAQALYGIVQGGKHLDMRTESARILGSMQFDGYGIGGEFGYNKSQMLETLSATMNALPHDLPRHVLGVGHPDDFGIIAQSGGDTFDCIAPTHYARHGTAFTSQGKLDLKNRKLLTDYTPIDHACKCDVCATYTRSYVSHLIRTHDLAGMKLVTVHNLYYFNALSKEVRRQIADDEI